MEVFPSDLKGWEIGLLSRHKLSEEQLRPDAGRADGTYLTPGWKNCTESPFLTCFRRFRLQQNPCLQRGLGDLQPTRGHSIKLSNNPVKYLRKQSFYYCFPNLFLQSTFCPSSY